MYKLRDNGNYEISQGELVTLLWAEQKLEALEGFGVDNWEGYGEAEWKSLDEVESDLITKA